MSVAVDVARASSTGGQSLFRCGARLLQKKTSAEALPTHNMNFIYSCGKACHCLVHLYSEVSVQIFHLFNFLQSIHFLFAMRRLCESVCYQPTPRRLFFSLLSK